MSGLLMGKTYNTTLSTNEKAVLGAYADHANDDGTSVFPGEPYMVIKTSLSKSTVRRITAILKTMGLLQQTKRGHTGQRAEFEIDVVLLDRIQVERPQRGSPPDTHYKLRDQALKWDTEATDWVLETTERVSENRERVPETTELGTTGATPNHHEPSEPSENHQLARSAIGTIKERHDAMVWALVDAMGWDRTEVPAVQWGRVHKAAEILTGIDADPGEVTFRAQVYRINLAGATMTPNAIAVNWADLATPREPIPARQVKRAAARAGSKAAIAKLGEGE